MGNMTTWLWRWRWRAGGVGSGWRSGMGLGGCYEEAGARGQGPVSERTGGMSVCSYFGKKPGVLRLRGEGSVAQRGEGRVLEGKLSVEDARAVAARGAWRLGETYESAGHYDPVLRSHCR